LARLLAKLPDEMRRPTAKLDGLSVAAAAARSHVSESDVKVSLHRGLRVLATAIAREKAT
jgi:RNA polymerase sigma-70 factor (ECF subfamily)